MVELLLAGMLGYLLGSVPTGSLLCWALQRVDVRQCGSGHTGGLNVSRVAGMWAGALTVAVDTLLGVGAATGALVLTGDPWAATTAGVMAVVGHDWSAFIHAGGGIGLSTLGGALLRLSPLRTIGAGLALVFFWFTLVRLLRVHRARATILAMVALGPLLWVIGSPPPSIASAMLGGAVVIIKTFPDWSRRYE